LAEPSRDLLLHRSTKVLTPNDFDSLAKLEAALLAFQERYEKSAAPFQWTFTRVELAKLMIRLNAKDLAPAAWSRYGNTSP
jgi:hypothetical protein